MMTKTIHLTGSEPMVADMARAVGYTGRKFRLESRPTVNVSSYWDGGSRDYFYFVKLDTMEVTPAVPAQSPFDRRIAGAESVTLPDGVACIKHTIYQGRDLGLTIIVPESNMTKLMPTETVLTSDQHTVLRFTAGYKSTYAGVPNLRFREAQRQVGITSDRWETAKAQCIARKLLNAAGAITVAGRNALSHATIA